MSSQYATVSYGSIVALGDATPPITLRENQFPLTEAEYLVLRAVLMEDDWEAALLEIIESIEAKRISTIQRMHHETS